MNRGSNQSASDARWVCKICGYIYDPAINGGVAFEALPETWRCPGCGFDKRVFQRLPNGGAHRSSP